MMTRFRNTIKILFWLMAIAVLLFFFLGELLLPANNGLQGARCRSLSTGWHLTGETKTFRLPKQLDIPRGKTVSVSLTLPMDIHGDDCLCVRSSKQEMVILIDGKVRKEYSTMGALPYGRSSVVAFVFVDLDKKDAGRELTIRTVTDTAYSGLYKNAYLGNWLGLIKLFVKQSWVEFSVSLLTIVMGLVCIGGGLFLKYRKKKSNNLEYLGGGAVFAGIWLVTNIVFRQGVFSNISVLNDVPYYMLMLMPLAFTFYFDGIQRYRYETFYLVLSVLLVGNIVTCTALHLTSRVDFADSVYLMAIFGVVTVFAMVFTVIIDIKRGFVKEYSSVVYGLMCALFTAVIQLFVYFKRTVGFNGIILALGLLILLIVSSVSSIQNIIRIDQEKTKAIVAGEAKARFLANMSHEIRTPINAVLGMNSIILRESREPETLEYARDISNAGQSLLSLINDILDFSKIESGKMEILPVEYELGSLIHDVVNMISEKVQKKGLKLEVQIDPEVSSVLYGDEVRIKQILVNLLNNAVKYTEKGTVSFSIERGSVKEQSVESGKQDASREDDELLLFKVQDTGIGIKKEDLPKLYMAFERLDEEKNRNIEGTGLGMSITMQLLELMGSSLQVESEYGVGSSFSFALRQAVRLREPVGNLTERLKNRDSTAPAYHALFEAPDAEILVVDDNAMNRKVFKGLLKKTKLGVDEASGGEGCLEKIHKKHYDIIFLDHMMTPMDGIETLHRMKEDGGHLCQDTPVIVLTANAIRGAKETYLSHGFQDYLSKPVNSAQLERMIRKYLPGDLIRETNASVLSEGRNSECGSVEKDGKPDLPEMERTAGADARRLAGESILPGTEQTAKQDHPEMAAEPMLPELSGVNWANVLAHMSDRAMLLDIIQTFYYGMGAEKKELEKLYREALASDDDAGLLAYETKVHAMKSEAAMAGIYALSGMAFTLEKAAKNGRRDIIEGLTLIFLEEWEGYEKELKEYFHKDQSNEDKPVLQDRKLLMDSMRSIYEALDELEADEADDIMAMLDGYRYEEPLEEVIDRLRGAVHSLDADAVKELMESEALSD